MTHTTLRYMLVCALLCLPVGAAAEQSTKEKIDKGVQDVSKPIQKVMEPVEKAITEGASKAASTVKKAVTSDKSAKPDSK